MLRKLHGFITVVTHRNSQLTGKKHGGDGYKKCNMNDDTNDHLMDPVDEVDSEELVGNSTNQRNWRGIGISLLVILVVCALIVTAVILVTPKEEDEEYGDKFTLEDMFNPDFKPKEFTVQWQSDKDKEIFVYRDEYRTLLEFDVTSNGSFVIMDNRTFRELDTDVYIVSPHRDRILIAYNIELQYRHSFVANYIIYQRTDRTKQDLADGERLQYVSWAPNGESILYIKGNNIFFLETIDSSPAQLTSDGVPDEVFNGIPDWVYEEEILGTDPAVWWSVDTTYLCYASFNDSHVPKFMYPIYGDGADAYGRIKHIAYPKPGYPNPTFKLKVVNLKTKNEVELSPPKEFLNKEYYFTAVTWRDNSYVLVVWLNRAQNHSIITICSADRGDCLTNLEERGHGGWVEMHSAPLFMPDGSTYFMILPQKEGKTGYFKHVAMVTAPVQSKPGERTFLTFGEWDVIQIVGYDHDTAVVYYIGTGSDPRKRHLYSVGLPDRNGYNYITCHSCELADDCQYVSAQFSNTGKYYILGCKGPGVPYFTLRSNFDNTVIMFESNAAVRAKLATRALPKKKYFEVEMEDGDYKVYGQMFLPPELKFDEVLTYPVLINVYGGPGSQKVTEKFSLGWETYLTSSHNIIYGSIDGRGSGGRGDKFLHQVYKRLGTVEIDDQLEAMKYFNNLHYVESTKLAIWGWSYGGFVTAQALSRQDTIFKCGMAVAPVTDWRYYDSIYTERYMGFPTADENLEGYKMATVARHAKDFPQSGFLLIHGSGDDNVHFQHSAQLIKALTDENIQFRLQLYTDEHHGLVGGTTRWHLYQTMEQFLEDCLELDEFRKQHEEAQIKSSNKQEKMDSA